MALISQTLPPLLGGVSQQIDERKKADQLRESINAYPDIAFGLIKRSGGQYITDLKAGSTVIVPPALDNAKWFSILRDQSEKYLGCIKGTNLYVWNLLTGVVQTVTLVGAASSYLTGTSPDDYHVFSVNDYTFVTNRKITVTAQATPGAWTRDKAFVTLNTVVYNSPYTLTINGTAYTYTTPATGVLSVATLMGSLKTLVDGIGAGWSGTVIGAGLYIVGPSAFSISVSAGVSGDALTVMQQTVPNVSGLPLQCTNDYTVKVSNTGVSEDDYYVKFVADNGSSGAGIWQETVSPLVSPGLTASTMPHELVRLSGGTFEFRQVTYEPRLVGDIDTNPNPSFVGRTLQSMFFYKNRLGVLTQDNVIMSQAGDYFNFFGQSALSAVDSDPIDISTSSTKPGVLRSAVPVPQGLVLFSSGEQFILTSTDDSFGPQTVGIKTLSRYEYDVNVDLADLGTSTAFVTKSPSFSRVFEVETVGSNDSPYIQDLTEAIPELIPSTISLSAGSAQSSMLALASPTSKSVWVFSFYSNGRERLQRAWSRWDLSGTVKYLTIENDVLWAVTQQQGSYVLQKLNIVQSAATSAIQSSNGASVDPSLDMWKVNATTALVGVNTRVYLPFVPDTSLTLCLVTGTGANAGVVYKPTVFGVDGTGNYAVVSNKNLTTSNVIIGYTFNYDVELPKFFYRREDKVDFTAYTVVSRIKFNFGLSGDIQFQVQAGGRDEWDETGGVKIMNQYLLDDIPMVESGIYCLPIHQRNTNFNIRIQSDSPFPVSLSNITWEGNYNPRSYTRA
jgi:hypothetical protein